MIHPFHRLFDNRTFIEVGRSFTSAEIDPGADGINLSTIALTTSTGASFTGQDSGFRTTDGQNAILLFSDPDVPSFACPSTTNAAVATPIAWSVIARHSTAKPSPSADPASPPVSIATATTTFCP